MRQYGDESWELDALRPQYLDDLVREHIGHHLDQGLWDERTAEIGHEHLRTEARGRSVGRVAR